MLKNSMFLKQVFYSFDPDTAKWLRLIDHPHADFDQYFVAYASK